MAELGDKLVIIGALAVMAASILYRIHLERIIQHLKVNHGGIRDDLAGGTYSKNPLILRNRLHQILDSGQLQGLHDAELNSKIRIFKISRYGIFLGVAVIIVGVLIMVTQ